ncbi:hypothetical protein L2E82_20138 [Cichorium intybus]|uniref:Uncharacterized protein n=1 Tax=Cichorium intybus TaxID=13427 RepID=A0ACB9DS96_CICIN|nr:hypothetical protein L2E82_20138 [Cichorium intybus]
MVDDLTSSSKNKNGLFDTIAFKASHKSDNEEFVLEDIMYFSDELKEVDKDPLDMFLEFDRPKAEIHAYASFIQDTAAHNIPPIDSYIESRSIPEPPSSPKENSLKHTLVHTLTSSSKKKKKSPTISSKFVSKIKFEKLLEAVALLPIHIPTIEEKKSVVV